MIDLWSQWCEKWPIWSIEDGLGEEDWDGWKKLTERLGDQLQLVGDDLFVTNVDYLQRGIAEQCGNDISSCGVSANKIRALQSVRAAECSGALCESQLEGLSKEKLISTLLKIHGVGPWTCDMALIFYFRMPDIWPEGDVAVQRTFKRFIGRRNSNAMARKFLPYRSYLALAMWRIVDGNL